MFLKPNFDTLINSANVKLFETAGAKVRAKLNDGTYLIMENHDLDQVEHAIAPIVKAEPGYKVAGYDMGAGGVVFDGEHDIVAWRITRTGCPIPVAISQGLIEFDADPWAIIHPDNTVIDFGWLSDDVTRTRAEWEEEVRAEGERSAKRAAEMKGIHK